MDPSLQLGIATELALVPLTAQSWAEIVAHAATNTVFQTFEWFEAWWDTFGKKHGLYFVWVKEREQVVAFAPLMLTSGSLGLRKLEFIGSGNADYLDFCYPQDRPELLAALVEGLQEHGDEWDVLRLANLPVQSATFQHLPALARRRRLRFLNETTVPCPTLVLKGRVAEVRGMIDKYSVRRKVNWFDKRGKLKISHLTDPVVIEAQLDNFFAQHSQRWHRQGAISQFERAEQRDFFRRLVRSLCKRSVLVFSVVTLDDVPLAYHFGFDYGDRMLWYKPSFNARYAGHSPGVVLTRGLIEEAVRRGKEEFDYTVGAEAFKFRFSNAVRANAYLNVYHARGRYSVALLLHTLRALARRIAQPLRAALLRKRA